MRLRGELPTPEGSQKITVTNAVTVAGGGRRPKVCFWHHSGVRGLWRLRFPGCRYA